MFLVMAKLMWGFEIEAEEEGEKMDVDLAWTPGFLTCCWIKCRSEEVEKAVEVDAHRCPTRCGWDLSVVVKKRACQVKT